MYEHRLFILTAMTNLHVGSGEQSFSVVDNTVQRDEVTQMPIILSSSLKGALRDFAQEMVTDSSNKLSPDHIQLIFGSDENSGALRFLQAGLLSIPMRSNRRPFYLATTMDNLMAVMDLAVFLGLTLDLQLPDNNLEPERVYVSDEDVNGLLVEDYACTHIDGLSNLQNLLGYRHLALIEEETFKSLIEILPVIARNRIGDNGQSINLFYEEVVPRQSRFGFFIGWPKNLAENDAPIIRNAFEELIRLMTTNPVQVGANASIGYGLTEIKEYTNE